MKQKLGALGGSKQSDERQTGAAGPTVVFDASATDALQSFELLQSQVAGLLGGTAVIGRSLGTGPLDAHLMLEAGIPNRAIDHLAHSLKVMGQESLEQAIGISLRTLQRK